jgi:hypothetical protein
MRYRARRNEFMLRATIPERHRGRSVHMHKHVHRMAVMYQGERLVYTLLFGVLAAAGAPAAESASGAYISYICFACEDAMYTMWLKRDNNNTFQPRFICTPPAQHSTCLNTPKFEWESYELFASDRQRPL